jgi:esterase/lipase superfamily enzyme
VSRLAIILLVVLCTACAPRAALVRVPDTVSRDLVTERVFVATTRALDEINQFGGQRSDESAYLHVDISVPPDREEGSLSWPNGDPSPDTEFLAAGAVVHPDAAAFRASIAAALRETPGREREAIIYIHGFNNNFADGVLRIEQLMHDFSLPGVGIHYSWPSLGNPLGYVHDRDSTLFGRDGLEDLIQQIEAAGATRIILVAHSIGSLLTMETLRQMAIARPGSVANRIGGVVLISPDIDVDVFRSQAARIGTLPQPFGIFVSKRDRALALSARLSGDGYRLGNLGNVDDVSDLDVTIIDLTNYSTGLGHFTVGSSLLVIEIFKRAGDFDTAFSGDAAGQSGILPGAVLTVQDATQIILSPITGLTQ